MPTEPDLRALLRGEPDRPGSLDAEAVIRRARARRRPKRIAVGALGGLAAAFVVVPVVVGIGAIQPGGAGGASDSAAAPERAKDASIYADGAAGSLEQGAAGCAPPGWDGAAVPPGVELTLTPGVDPAHVQLTLANGSEVGLHGELAGAPMLAISADDTPIGWSATTLPGARVDVDPGEQVTWSVPLELVTCSGETAAGAYEAEAALGIRLDGGELVVANSGRTEIIVAAAE